MKLDINERRLELPELRHLSIDRQKAIWQEALAQIEARIVEATINNLVNPNAVNVEALIAVRDRLEREEPIWD